MLFTLIRPWHYKKKEKNRCYSVKTCIYKSVRQLYKNTIKRNKEEPVLFVFFLDVFFFTIQYKVQNIFGFYVLIYSGKLTWASSSVFKVTPECKRFCALHWTHLHWNETIHHCYPQLYQCAPLRLLCHLHLRREVISAHISHFRLCRTHMLWFIVRVWEKYI